MQKVFEKVSAKLKKAGIKYEFSLQNYADYNVMIVIPASELTSWQDAKPYQEFVEKAKEYRSVNNPYRHFDRIFTNDYEQGYFQAYSDSPIEIIPQSPRLTAFRQEYVEIAIKIEKAGYHVDYTNLKQESQWNCKEKKWESIYSIGIVLKSEGELDRWRTAEYNAYSRSGMMKREQEEEKDMERRFEEMIC